MIVAHELLEAIEHQISKDGGYHYRRLLALEMRLWAEQYGVRPDIRKHLGPSSLGHECDRKVWYEFRKAEIGGTPDAAKVRLFSRGDIEEPRVHALLKLVGGSEDITTKRRFSRFAGHYGGEVDALYANIPGEPVDAKHGVEIKSYNRSRFGTLVLHGVKESDETYYNQMQAYGREHGVPWFLFIATNKDNDQLHAEWVETSANHGKLLEDRAIYIINVDSPPSRIRDDKTWYICKMCDKHGICHKYEPIAPNCRTCAHATPDTENGGWTCEKDQSEIVLETGCDLHVYLPGLVPPSWAYKTGDGDNAYYTNGDRELCNGPEGLHGTEFWQQLGD